MRRVSRIGLAALAVSAASISVMAAPLPPDPAAIWTLQDENSTISSAKVTDRYYTNGLRLGYTSPTDAMPDALNGVADKLWGPGQRRWSFNLSQQIYTPFNTAAQIPPAGDMPYSGLLMGSFGLNSDTETSRSHFGLGLGVIGPAAMGEQVQNGFHDLIGQGHNNGWGSQLKNEPVIQFTSSRIWRLPIGTLGGLETDVLPELTAGAGSVRIYALTGLTLRLGQGLTADFGPARVRPGLSGGDAFVPTHDFGWYVFVGADGQAVAHDITLDGDVFSKGPSVRKQPFVGEGQGGLAVMLYGARLAYTHVVQSTEFKQQKGGFHQFGSLSLSLRF